VLGDMVVIGNERYNRIDIIREIDRGGKEE
jgi:hypothetical protein